MRKIVGYLILFIFVIFIVPTILTSRSKPVASNAIQTDNNTNVNNEEITVQKTSR